MSYIDNRYMMRCLELARLGMGKTYPNPMVGSVIVYKDKIVGEGYHQIGGGPHAEVNALSSVTDKKVLSDSVLYVNLEPCSHYGKTPPCTKLIIENKLPRVVIGCKDPFLDVNGEGIHQLIEAGIDVTVGVLEKESIDLNRRFFTYHNKKRPYIILKWAATRDGFLDINREVTQNNRPTWITNEHARRLVHLWRSREQAILVGSETALKDNPSLTVRCWSGSHPLRLVLDRDDRLPESLSLFNGEASTLYFTGKNANSRKNAIKVVVSEDKNPVIAILDELYTRQIQSLIVEGGAQLLQAFIDLNLWDEARVFTGNRWFKDGVKAPVFRELPHMHEKFRDCDLLIYKNTSR